MWEPLATAPVVALMSVMRSQQALEAGGLHGHGGALRADRRWRARWCR